jgi:ATP-binding cassette subfamily C protein
VPLEEIGMDVVREHVVTVLQNPVLFNDTIRNNLTLGRKALDRDLWDALAVAQLKDAVSGFPQGLDTVVGRQGLRLSGGQRQRLAIARMLLLNPRVVILDEATSALDGETESNLFEALDPFLRERTTILVAHRVSAVRQADRVVVIDEGGVQEQGSHEMLMAREGIYARLFGQYGALSLAGPGESGKPGDERKGEDFFFDEAEEHIVLEAPTPIHALAEEFVW